MGDRSRFPSYYQLYSLDTIGRGLQGVLEGFDWNRLAVVSENHTRFSQV